MTEIHHQATIGPEMAGYRLDRALAEMFPEHSRASLARWIKAGEVTVDGAVALPRRRIHGGEHVRITAVTADAAPPQPQAMTLDIRHEDADLLVLCKPAGRVVHPGAGHADGTLLNALLHHDPGLAELPRAGIVHRLDKDTSGLLLVARSAAAQEALSDMLARHEVMRRYAAVVSGAVIAGGRIDAPLARHPRQRQRRAVVADGKPACTHYRIHERYRVHTLLRCWLETGRTHQIRVHMAHAGFPVLGDPVYGGKPRLPPRPDPALIQQVQGFSRQALHAEHLAFTHPITGEAMAFDAALPTDMAALVAALQHDAGTDGQRTTVHSP